MRFQWCTNDFQKDQNCKRIRKISKFLVIFEAKFCFIRGSALDLVGDSCYNIQGVLKLSAIYI